MVQSHLQLIVRSWYFLVKISNPQNGLYFIIFRKIEKKYFAQSFVKVSNFVNL